jgi:hypothetical protein
MVAYSGANEQWAAFGLSMVACIMLVTSNVIFFVVYKKDIMNDETFFKWTRLYPKSQKFLPLVSLFLNFKTIKFVYSGFFGLESCLA